MVGISTMPAAMNPRIRIAAASVALVGIVAGFEGYRGTSYDDGVGVQTIGFGRTEGVKPGQKTDPVREVIHLSRTLDSFADDVLACIGPDVPMHQHEFDAFVSLAYNVGVGAFCRGSIPRLLRDGDYAAACGRIRLYNKAGGQIVPGLVKRREAEARMCEGMA